MAADRGRLQNMQIKGNKKLNHCRNCTAMQNTKGYGRYHKCLMRQREKYKSLQSMMLCTGQNSFQKVYLVQKQANGKSQ